MLEPIDLLMLSVRAPLADAVCATVCRRWREAADLWLDVIREPHYAPLAAHCGLEASLNAGLYDVAQYFHVMIDDNSRMPEFLSEPWRKSLPIRRSRARLYAEKSEISFRAATHGATQRLVDLRLYREAVRDIFARRVYQTNPIGAVRLLAACYFALGEHEALIGLHRSRRWCFGGPAVRSMLENAKVCLSRADLGPVENTLWFARSHPAGALLAPFLDASPPMISAHG
jgi:hypothetical protein